MGLYVKKLVYSCVFKKKSVLDKNKCYRFISCVMFVSIGYFERFVLHQFFEFDSLKITNKEIYKISTTLIYFDFNFTLCLLYLCIIIYIIRCEETISVTIFI